ncbi:MAG: hypothetical protein IKL84_03215 [Clostridia bacterium]|nr:hypothetical protein [Clostridia bacterium]
MKKQLVALLLAAIMVLPLAACANDPTDLPNDTTVQTDPQTTTQTPAETTVPEETEPELLPDLPDVGDQYKGTELSVIHRGRNQTHYPERWMEADAITGDTIIDAVYKRNSYLEEKYGIKIVHTIHDDVHEALDVASNSQDDIYDIALPEISSVGSRIVKGLFYDFHELPYINFDQPWWDSNCAEATGYNGKNYIAVGDLSLSSQASCSGVILNRDLIREYKLEDPYELVKNNQWTLEKLATMVQAGSDDLDGDGQWTDEDRYGMLNAGASTFVISGGVKIVEKSANGEYSVACLNEKTMSILDICRTFLVDKTMYRAYGDLTPEGDRYLYGRKLFSEDHFLFMTGSTNRFNEFAANNMESEYGIVPNPKFDSEQENYYHTGDDLTSCLVVPATNQIDDLERLSILLEDMSYFSSKTILPEYYETLIARRRGRVPEVGQMVDIIKNSIYYDLTFIYPLSYSDAISSAFKTGNYSSTFTRYERILDMDLKKIIKNLESLG